MTTPTEKTVAARIFRPTSLQLNGLTLGLGLFGIGGRSWQPDAKPVTKAEAYDLLDAAYAAGIRFFDTAPSYGVSEQILGDWLSDRRLRRNVTIATKMGEGPDPDTGELVVDHSAHALLASVWRSLERLGAFDVLQLHRPATAQDVRSTQVLHAINHAHKQGVREFGVSVPNIDIGRAALEVGAYQWIQFPLNSANPWGADFAAECLEKGVMPIINRPVNSGKLVTGDTAASLTDAYRFVRSHVPTGMVLTGTSKVPHLAQNIAAFEASKHT